MKHTTIKAGQQAPNFCLPDADENKVCLEDFRGMWVVLYFYPRDNTPGCSLEAHDFTRLKDQFQRNSAQVLAVSKDSCRSHRNFRDKKSLSILLLSDETKDVQTQYGVWRTKRLAGREFLGTVRTTFLIDPKGTVSAVWEAVRVQNHAQEVLDTLHEWNSRFKQA